MSSWSSINDILDFAITGEEEAAAFYQTLANQVEKAWMKKALLGFALEEAGHKAKLEAIKAGKKLFPAQKSILDLKVGDYLVEAEIIPDMSYQDALIVAMKKEKAAFKLYSDLAASTDDKELRSTLLSLAHEEANHKLRFEVEYDEYVLVEN
ncbi:MAG: ferritin family protein [bacterium]